VRDPIKWPSYVLFADQDNESGQLGLSDREQGVYSRHDAMSCERKKDYYTCRNKELHDTIVEVKKLTQSLRLLEPLQEVESYLQVFRGSRAGVIEKMINRKNR
jgi:hypothetical protein